MTAGRIGAEELAKVLKVNTLLEELHLRNNNLGDSAVRVLFEALKDNRHCRLHTLTLDNNK